VSMQTDVLSAHRTSTGELVAYRTRVKSIVVTSSGTAGSVVLKDGGSGGETKVTILTPAAAGIENVLLPGEGLLFRTDVHLTLTNASGVTVFYG
jgi:hypothetical protein